MKRNKNILSLLGIILSILTTSCHVEIKHGDEEDRGSNFEYREDDEDSEPDTHFQFQYNPALKQFSPSISP